MRVAIIHDWLISMRGGERCLEVLCQQFGEVELYTLFYERRAVSKFLSTFPLSISLLNKFPGVKKYHRYLLPLYPLGAWHLSRQLKKHHAKKPYDLVLSVSHCAAKNVAVPKGVPHLCYCLTPMRYVWDQYDSYFAGRSYEPLVRPVAALLRRWDRACASRVTKFVGISDYIRQRIQRVYGRDADVAYPPCSSDWIMPREKDEVGDGFLSVNALVPYKNVHLIVEAFNELGLPLTIVGRGPEEVRLKAMAKDNITFLSAVSDAQLATLYKKSRALVFAAEEDFGMTPVESQAAGRPVICYGKGGALETVNSSAIRPTGVHFSELNAASICGAVQNFMDREKEFTVDNCLIQAEKFSVEQFKSKFAGPLAELGFGASSLDDRSEANSAFGGN